MLACPYVIGKLAINFLSAVKQYGTECIFFNFAGYKKSCWYFVEFILFFSLFDYESQFPEVGLMVVAKCEKIGKKMVRKNLAVDIWSLKLAKAISCKDSIMNGCLSPGWFWEYLDSTNLWT